jgi:hypothetical protein
MTNAEDSPNIFLLFNAAASTFFLIFLAMLIAALQVPADAMLRCAALPAVFIVAQLMFHWVRVSRRIRRENAPVPPLMSLRLSVPPLYSEPVKSPYACRVHKAGDLNDDRYQIGEENVYIGDDGELYYYDEDNHPKTMLS